MKNEPKTKNIEKKEPNNKKNSKYQAKKSKEYRKKSKTNIYEIIKLKNNSSWC